MKFVKTMSVDQVWERLVNAFVDQKLAHVDSMKVEFFVMAMDTLIRSSIREWDLFESYVTINVWSLYCMYGLYKRAIRKLKSRDGTLFSAWYIIRDHRNMIHKVSGI